MTQEDIKKRVRISFREQFGHAVSLDGEYIGGSLDGAPVSFSDIQDFISQALDTAFREWAEAVRMEQELHTHDSIPSYEGGLEDGCRICIKNQTIDELNKKLQELGE